MSSNHPITPIETAILQIESARILADSIASHARAMALDSGHPDILNQRDMTARITAILALMNGAQDALELERDTTPD